MDDRDRLRMIGVTLGVLMLTGVVAMGVVAWRQVQAARAAAAVRMARPTPQGPLSDVRDDGQIVYTKTGEDEIDDAVAEARRRWPEFVAAFRKPSHRPGDHFMAKGAFGDGEEKEWMWFDVDSIDADRSATGTLENDPAHVPLRRGQRVTVKVADIGDWIYKDASGIHGGFVERVLRTRMK
jgi:uncharacterized protein YegJ (DUF2314 family)